MAGAVDIFELDYAVEVRGKRYEIPGLKFKAIGKLIVRFPEIRKQIEMRALDVPALLDLADDALAAVIAGGLGKVGDKTTEKWAASLSLGEQSELIHSIYKATVGPKGVRPFVLLMEEVGLGSPSDTASDTTSPSQPSPSSNEAGQKAA